MAYIIARIEKYKAVAVKGIEIHDQRERPGRSHTNPDIDWELSKTNYDLHNDQQVNFRAAVNRRIGSLGLEKAVRKDAIVMCGVLVTASPEWFKDRTVEQTRKFFEDSYAFVKKRYGGENIVSATVHMDEATPHLHVNLVPVTEDGRLCAKDLTTRANLRDFQDRVARDVGSVHGLSRGQENSKAKHMRIEDLKRETDYRGRVRDEIRDLQAERERTKTESERAAADLEATRARIGDLRDDVDRLKAEIGTLTEIRTKIGRDDFQPQKTIGGNIKLTSDQYNLLAERSRAYHRLELEKEGLTKTADMLKRTIASLERTASAQWTELRKLDTIGRVLEKRPDLRTEIERETEEIAKTRDRDFGDRLPEM